MIGPAITPWLATLEGRQWIVSSGLTLDLDAAASRVAVSGALVETWIDPVLGNNYVAAGVARPTWTATGWNGNQPAVSWDGVNTYMTGPALSALVTTTQSTMFFVEQVDAVATDSATAYANPALFSGDGTACLGAGVRSSGQVYGWNFGAYVKASQSMSLGAKHVICVRQLNAELKVWVDGVAGTPATIGATAALTGATYIGANYNHALHVQGKTARRLIYNRGLSVNEIAQNFAALTAQYL